MWYTHTHIYMYGILLSHKKEWNNAICSNMDGPRDYHTKWSKSDRERQILYVISYMKNLKNWSKRFYITKQKQSHRQREQRSGYQWGKVRWEEWDKGMGLRGTNYYV